MAGSITVDEARRELARRELARRRQQSPDAVALPSSDGPQPPSPMPSSMPAARMQSGADAAILGALDTATFGFLDEAAAGIDSLIGGKTYDQALSVNRSEAEGAQKNYPSSYLAGQIGGALLPGAGLASAGASAGARAVQAGRPLWQVAAGSAADGAAMGALQGFGSGEGVSDRLASAEEGAKFGVAGGAVAPYLAAGLGAVARGVVSPIRGTPERQALAAALRGEGVDVSAGQATGSRSLRYAESEIGGPMAMDLMDRQGEQFTSAALRRAGVDAPRATPEVIDQAFTRIGGQFDDLAARNQIVPDQQLTADLTGVVDEYRALVPEAARAPVVEGLANDITTLSQNGSIPGATYQSFRSRLDRASRSSRDPELAGALRGMRETLDDAMGRSIAATNPADAGAWQEVRRQYRNMIVLERAATGAGENAAAGLISPSQLRNATVGQNRRAYARGQGDFAELARAGEAVLKPLPDSGTAGRLAARGATGLPALAGALLGQGATGDVAGGLIGAGAGAVATRALGRALMSDMGQRYLGNQAAEGMRLAPNQRALIDALLRSEASASAGRLSP